MRNVRQNGEGEKNMCLKSSERNTFLVTDRTSV